MPSNYNADYEHLTGLERLQHFERSDQERFGVARMLGYSIETIGEGRVVLRYQSSEEHLNLFSTVHGGILAALMDTAMGCALMTMLDAGEYHTIIDLHSKYLRPVTLYKTPLKIVANVEHRGRRQCTMRAEISCPDGKSCATGTATAMIL